LFLTDAEKDAWDSPAIVREIDGGSEFSVLTCTDSDGESVRMGGTVRLMVLRSCDEDVTSHVVSAHGEGSSRCGRLKRYNFGYPTLLILEPLNTFRGAYIS
jgi:hypothetical protein